MKKITIFLISITFIFCNFFGCIEIPLSEKSRPTVVAKIIKTSTVPDPEKTPYEDYLVGHKLKKVKLIRGSDVEDNFIVFFWGFKNRRLEPGSKMKRGQELLLTLTPWDQSTEDIKKTKRSFTKTPSDGHPQYFSDIFNFEDPAPSQSKAGSSQPSEEGKGKISSDLLRTKGARTDYIRFDKEKIEKLLDENGRDNNSINPNWENWYEGLENLRQKLLWQTQRWNILINEQENIYFENMNWLFYKLENEDQGFWPKNAIQTLIDTNRYLAEKGIDFIVVPVPPKEYYTAKSFAGSMFPDNGIIQPYRYKLFLHLLKAGIEVVDLLPYILKHTSKNDLAYYPTSDQHPADFLVQLSAKVISNRLMRYNFVKKEASKTGKFIPRKATETIPTKFSKRDYKKRYDKNYMVKATQILDEQGNLLKSNDTSPLLIVGDSFAFCTKNRGIPGADIWAHIAKGTGIIPKTITKPAAAAKVKHHLKRLDDKALKQIKVCILFFNEKYLLFHEDEWGL